MRTKIISDPYNRKVRLQPALLAALPLGVGTLAWFPEGIAGWGILWGLVVWSGGTTLLTQLGRDSGLKKEAHLYDKWGGKPTTALLRHRSAPNKVLLKVQQKKLQSLVPELVIPSLEQEQADPDAADEVYDACVAILRERTRDRAQFGVLFEENCNYGFRRNLWGMKAVGTTLAVLGLVLAGLSIVRVLWDRIPLPSPLVPVAIAINLALLLAWIFWFTSDWVRIPAKAYASRLLASIDTLLQE